MSKKGKTDKITAEMIDEICARIADGESLNKICKDEHIVSRQAFFNYIKDHEEAIDKYKRAREFQADYYADKILEVSENQELGEVVEISEHGTKKTISDMISHRRLKIDTYKWLAGKLKPKVYSDKFQLEHSGEVTNKVIKVDYKDDIDSDDLGLIDT